MCTSVMCEGVITEDDNGRRSIAHLLVLRPTDLYHGLGSWMLYDDLGGRERGRDGRRKGERERERERGGEGESEREREREGERGEREREREGEGGEREKGREGREREHTPIMKT